MCLRVSYKKKNMKIFFPSLKSLKKGVGSGVGSGSGSDSQRYGSPEPDLNQNVTDPQHWVQSLPWSAPPWSSQWRTRRRCWYPRSWAPAPPTVIHTGQSVRSKCRVASKLFIFIVPKTKNAVAKLLNFLMSKFCISNLVILYKNETTFHRK